MKAMHSSSPNLAGVGGPRAVTRLLLGLNHLNAGLKQEILLHHGSHTSLAAGSGCWWAASVPCPEDLIGLLKYPHDIVADFPQGGDPRESKEEAAYLL